MSVGLAANRSLLIFAITMRSPGPFGTFSDSTLIVALALASCFLLRGVALIPFLLFSRTPSPSFWPPWQLYPLFRTLTNR